MTRYFIKSIISVLFMVAWTTVIWAQDNNDNHPRLIKECEDFILKNMESGNIVGVSGAIIINDTVVWKKGFGYSDKEKKVPMSVNTAVNIASVTKTFTALAIMQLYEKGLLDINKPLAEYLPQFNPGTRGENLEELTIKSVITHSSGIQSDILKNSDSHSGNYTDVLGYINDTYLLSPPGLVESYSNSGYNILGHLVKEVSKLDYPDYIKKNIFTPLEMNNSGFLKDSIKTRTKIYSGGESMFEYGFRDIASGGIYSTINDLIKYARGLMQVYNDKNSDLIKPALIREMFSLHPECAVIESNKKGLGWFMFKNDSVFAVTHAGDAVTGHAEICLIPEKNSAVIILINSTEGEPLRKNFCLNFVHKFGLTVADIIPPPVIEEYHNEIEPVMLSDEILKSHEGDYSQGFSFLTISNENGNLVMLRDNKYYILKALAENEFVPFEKSGDDIKSPKDNERYFFMDSGNLHILFFKTGTSESQLGYKLNTFDPSLLNKKLGAYEHYGYQLLIGDTKFKGAELSIAENRILMLKLIADDGEYPFLLDLISDKYAVTSGLGTGFGYTVKLRYYYN
jgi:CubicO group peptidase (beta-lactamase class C family)